MERKNLHEAQMAHANYVCLKAEELYQKLLNNEQRFTVSVLEEKYPERYRDFKNKTLEVFKEFYAVIFACLLEFSSLEDYFRMYDYILEISDEKNAAWIESVVNDPPPSLTLRGGGFMVS